MAKATHEGTCQICGKGHKLPNGKLSKHGYTVDFGTFNGTCNGAEGLPFEKSTDLISGAIEKVKAAIVETEAELKDLDTQTEKVHVRFYAHGHHFWHVVKFEDVQTKILNAEQGYHIFYAVNPEAVTHRRLKNVDIDAYGDLGRTKEESIINHNKENWGRYLTNRISSMEKYVEWQQERLENWVEKDLIAI